EIFSNLETLFGYFEIAKTQNWVNEKNIEILKTEYQKLQKLVKVTPQQKLSEQRPRTISRVSSRTSIEKEESSPKKFEGGQEKLSPKERKAKILQLLNYKKSITLSEIKNIFFQVSQRTLRRDMESLIKEGIVKRKRLGQKDVLYTLIK
ncbi:MAG: DeoR family transcriptional regulator, partial [Candidatus Pacebacteria bacterium]|nr:DeoR family transcriptional regulator [Candidatus Paceibacterota bacterium]